MVIRIDIPKPCDPTTDARVVRSGPTAVPTPPREWHVPQGSPWGDFVNRSRPRCTWAVGGFLSWADETSSVPARMNGKYKALSIISPFRGEEANYDFAAGMRRLQP